MEDALCRVCWEQAVNVTSLRIEGTTTIIVDNKDVILIQLDQVNLNTCDLRNVELAFYLLVHKGKVVL